MANLFRALLTLRGERIVECPETQQPVAARIHAPLAAGTWLLRRPRYVISACSRWPARAGCDQACAPQIAANPEQTLVRDIVTRWYGERTCAYCGKAIREIGGAAIVPALRRRDGELFEWHDVAAEDLPRVLADSVAVCARCGLAEDFRRRFPERVIDRVY